MKKLILIFVILCIVSVLVPSIVLAKNVKIEDARQAAENWVALITALKGSWGGSEEAYVEDVQEFRQRGRKIGYFANVHPKGFIIVSVRKELAPIKAYSDENDLNPDADTGLPDLIKGKMNRIIRGIEQRAGVLDRIPDHALDRILEINYHSAWDDLIGTEGERSASAFTDEVVVAMNYQGGDYLIRSSWHQNPPYNNMTPDLGCTTTSNGRAKVGCVALAASQIMDYWNWPPYGTGLVLPEPFISPPTGDPYDWPNILDVVTTGSATAEQDAVAELTSEVGVAVSMNYGCGTSGAFVDNMPFVYENYYRYSGYALYRTRVAPVGGTWPAITWFNYIKDELNLNRPIQYDVREWHSFVADGWQEIGSTPVRQYHMNYGWGYECEFLDGCNTWYTLDSLYYADSDSSIVKEAMVTGLFPAQSVQDTLSGTYARNPDFPYYYFDQDATGHSATFVEGLNLQFLHGISVTNTSTTGGSFRFESSAFEPTRLFTRGDPSKGVRLEQSGTLKISQNGSIRFQ